MSSNTPKETYTLTPSWKLFFVGYVLSIITIPIGIGIIAFYFIRKKHKSYTYIITDSGIEAIDARYEQHIDLVDIHSVTIKKSWLQQKVGIGSLVIESSSSRMILQGLERAAELKSILDQAIKTEHERKEEQQEIKTRETNYKPGSMERIEYLTGLWQQGLLSEEDYKKERKHVE